VEPLLNRAENMGTKDRENVVLDAIFTLDFSGKTCLRQSQVPETSGKVRSKQDLPLVKEG